MTTENRSDARPAPTGGRLLAVSDLHISYQENRDLVEKLQPTHPDDWLLVAGDVAELTTSIEWALRLLAERFARVVWVPGNHELWTTPRTRSSCAAWPATSTWWSSAAVSVW